MNDVDSKSEASGSDYIAEIRSTLAAINSALHSRGRGGIKLPLEEASTIHKYPEILMQAGSREPRGLRSDLVISILFFFSNYT